MRIAGGYFDVQINGGWGHHFSRDPSSIWEVGARLIDRGVTQFLPTLVSDGFDLLEEALAVLAAGPPEGWRGARPLGWHLEGPWLNPDRAGAHDRSALRPPALTDMITRDRGVSLVTLAPEVDGAVDVIQQLAERGVVVSMGHTAVDYGQAVRAIGAGASMGTHLFNAMGGLHHRDPGLAAALLDDERVAVGLIADGFHVAPEMVRLAWRLAGERIVLVSDAVSLLGVTTEPVARRSDGTLMGATISLDRCVRNVVEFAHVDLGTAAAAASERPRRVLGIDGPPGTWIDLDPLGNVVGVTLEGQRL